MASKIQNPVYDDISHVQEQNIGSSYEPLHVSGDRSPKTGNTDVGRQPNRQLKACKGATIVLSILCSVLIVGIFLVYFIHPQLQVFEEEVGETTSVIPTANLDSVQSVENDCSIYPCFNGGSCRMNQQQPSCVCPHGYSGDYCEKIHYCVNHTCLHGGSCVEDSCQARCECLLGYQGNHCETDVVLAEHDITNEIAGCEASTEYSSRTSPCEEAFDGSTVSHSSWVSRGEGVGAWYEMYLREPRVITQLHVMQRCDPAEQTDRMTVLIGSNFTQEIELRCNSYDCEFGLQEFRINPGAAKSSVIRITFTQVCSTANNGLIELKLWGY